MMWQILIAVMLVWFAVSVAAAFLVGGALRRSGAALDVPAPGIEAEVSSTLDMVRAG